MAKLHIRNELWVNGLFCKGDASDLKVLNKWTQEEVVVLSLASDAQLKTAEIAALNAFEVSQNSTFKQRRKLLEALYNGIADQKERFINCIHVEAGKTMQYARLEVERALFTIEIGMAFCLQDHGQTVNLGVGDKPHLLGLVQPFPAGPVLAFSPFNFPLNLALHKLVPAWAAGCPVVLKPSPQTPLSALLLAEVFEKYAKQLIHESMLQVVLCNNMQAGNLVESDAFKVFTFTGSDTVGWELKKRANRKKVILELGGTAPVIIEKTALNLPQIAKEIVQSAFQFAGQVCISSQHIYIDKSLKATFLNLLNEALHKEWPALQSPLISKEASQRVAALVNDAKTQGAVDLYNRSESQQNGSNILPPSVLINVPVSHALYQEEAFGPVLLVHEFVHIQPLITHLNESKYGLQTAVYTENQAFIKQLYKALQTGALIVNNSPGFRLDNMPYGGVKNSGFGREGIAYAFEEMTEKKLLVW